MGPNLVQSPNLGRTLTQVCTQFAPRLGSVTKRDQTWVKLGYPLTCHGPNLGQTSTQVRPNAGQKVVSTCTQVPKFVPSLAKVCTIFGHGTSVLGGLNRTWAELGPNLVRTWVFCVSNLGQTWAQVCTNLESAKTRSRLACIPLGTTPCP